MSQLKCNQCLNHFGSQRIPKLMPSCSHSLCQICLDDIFDSDISEIRCGFCQNIQCIKQTSKGQFSKNISLYHKIKDQIKNTKPVHHNVNDQNDILLAGLEDHHFMAQENELCKIHQKSLEIICLTDKINVCSDCALFGIHKGHHLINYKQFEKQIICAKSRILSSFSQKQQLSMRIQEQITPQKLQRYIQIQKGIKIDQIYNKFKQIKEELLENQNKVYDKINVMYEKVFKSIIKQESNLEKIDIQLNSLELQTKGLLHEVQLRTSGQNLRKKLHLFYDCLEVKLNQYDQILQSLNTTVLKIQSKKKEQLEKIIVQISIMKNFHFDQIVSVREQKVFKMNMQSVQDKSSYNGLRRMKSSDDLFSTLNNSRISEKNQRISIKSSKGIVGTSSNVKSLKNNQKTNSQMLQSLKSSQKNPILLKNQSPKKIQNTFKTQRCQGVLKKQHHPIKTEKNFEQYVNKQGDIIDLVNCQFQDREILQIVSSKSTEKGIKGLKICRNRLTNKGFKQLLPYLHEVVNLNLSENQLSQEILDYFISDRSSFMKLRIINLTRNQISTRAARQRIEELKKNGIIVMI